MGPGSVIRFPIGVKWAMWFAGLVLVFIMPLSAQSAPAHPADTAVRDYHAYLAGLDKDNLDSFSGAVAYFKNIQAQLPVVRRDSLFKAFRTYFYAGISHHNDRIWEDLDFIERLHADDAETDSIMTAYRKTLRRNGLELFKFGRLYYVDQQNGYLYRQFYPYLSRAVQDFLAIRRTELKSGFSNRDSLLISFAQLGIRIITWERYLERYPDSVIRDAAHYYYRIYLSTFVTGLKNSPVFDDYGIMPRVLRRVYDNFIRSNPDTEAARIVGAFYSALLRDDFRWSTNVREFYTAHSIINMHKAQAPYR